MVAAEAIPRPSTNTDEVTPTMPAATAQPASPAAAWPGVGACPDEKLPRPGVEGIFNETMLSFPGPISTLREA